MINLNFLIKFKSEFEKQFPDNTIDISIKENGRILIVVDDEELFLSDEFSKFIDTVTQGITEDTFLLLDFDYKSSDSVYNCISEFISSHTYRLHCTINKHQLEQISSDDLAKEIISKELSKSMFPYLESIPIKCEESINEYLYSRTLTILSEKDLDKFVHLLKSYYTRIK